MLGYAQLYTLTTSEGKMALRLRIVETYRECGSLRETARRLSVSRNTVRKWVRRYQEFGEVGLRDRSRRPKRSPRRTPPEVSRGFTSLWGEVVSGAEGEEGLSGQGGTISPDRRRGVSSAVFGEGEGDGGIASPGPEAAMVLQCEAATLWGGDGGKATDGEIARVRYESTG